MTQTNEVITEATALIASWNEEHHQQDYDPIPTLTRLAELMEIETKNYWTKNPDPFEQVYCFTIDPDCELAQILKLLSENENFMKKVVKHYLRDTYYHRLGITGRDIDDLNVAACRFLLNVVPNIDTSEVFLLLKKRKLERLVDRLIRWTEDSIEPLQSYATGLLAAAMEIPEIAKNFREQNLRLAPLLFERLKKLQEFPKFSLNQLNVAGTSSAHLNSFLSCGSFKLPKKRRKKKKAAATTKTSNVRCSDRANLGEPHSSSTEDSSVLSKSETNQNCKRIKLDNKNPVSPHKQTSNSFRVAITEFRIGNIQMYPLNRITRQIFILRYFCSLEEHEDFSSHVFEIDNVLKLILSYMYIMKTKEARLAFEALKYLAALLNYEENCLKFVDNRNLMALLSVPRRSVAATGVSLCLYNLASCERAMEQICLLSMGTFIKLMRYALWLLQRSKDSGKCYAIMFFGAAFQFKAVVNDFDWLNGLKKFHNAVFENDSLFVYKYIECTGTKIAKHVSFAYKRYLETHLYMKVEFIRSRMIASKRYSRAFPFLPHHMACKSSPEKMQEQIDILLERMLFYKVWAPVDTIFNFGDIHLLLEMVTCEVKHNGCAETIRYALDALAVAGVDTFVQFLFCESIGIGTFLEAAEGKTVQDADVQKAALRIIVNCVCARIHRCANPTTSEELIHKMWESVLSNNGILILSQIIVNTKTPINDADAIRALACKALSGLARSESVRQILSEVEMFNNGQLQNLMRDPISQVNIEEHVKFRKYAFDLIEILSKDAKVVSYKYPDLKSRIATANNMVIRCARNVIGHQCKRIDRKFTHSQFCPVQTIIKGGSMFTCATFMPGGESILLGKYHIGCAGLFNLQSGDEELEFQVCYNSNLDHLEPNRNGTLLLTSAVGEMPMSALFGVNNWDKKLQLANEQHAQFSRVSQDRILGTQAEAAVIYDVNTRQSIMYLMPTISNKYKNKRATFNYDDKLVLYDGALFDVASGEQIYKLDKLNQLQNGVFHPNCVEIICNTEIWDMRMFHLLKTVSDFDQCRLIFSPVNNVIYAVTLERDDFTDFKYSFTTVDAVDYSSIKTVRVKNKIHGLAVNEYDTQIAIVENQELIYHPMQRSVVRIYDVGKKRYKHKA